MDEKLVREIVSDENLVYKKTSLLTEKVLSYCPGCGHGTAPRHRGAAAAAAGELGVAGGAAGGRGGGRALVLDLGADPAGDPHLEVGGREAQAPAFGGQQDIAQHRQRTAPRGGAVDDAEAAGEVFLQAGDFHCGGFLREENEAREVYTKDSGQRPVMDSIAKCNGDVE